MALFTSLAKVATAVLAGIALSAAAAPAPPADATDVYEGQIPDLVSSLVVQAASPGPAWWKVTKGDATLWILGTPPYGSDERSWDQRALMRRLKGANAFILPNFLETQPIIDTDDARRAGDLSKGQLPSAQNYDGLGPPLVKDLPAEIQDRIHADQRALGVDRISGASSLIFASRWLSLGMMKRASLSLAALQTQLQVAARSAGIRAFTLPVDAISPSVTYIRGPAAPKLACLNATLGQAESGPDPLGGAYLAWTKGDVPNALATVGCVGVKAAVYRQEVALLMPILTAALATPGKTVAAVELIPLVMKDGLVQQLQAAGYTVQQPDTLTDIEG